MPVYPGAPPHFFSPRLEVVVQEQNSDRLPTYARNQFAFHGFLGHQSHGPAGTTLGRVAAHHGDNTLFLAVRQQFGGSRPLFLVEGAFQAALLVTMSNLPNGLRSQSNNASDARRTEPPG